jgi:hypothetical protein
VALHRPRKKRQGCHSEELQAVLSIAKEESRIATKMRRARSFATLRVCDFFDLQGFFANKPFVFNADFRAQSRKSQALRMTAWKRFSAAYSAPP